MDKYRKAMVELCAAVELAHENANEDNAEVFVKPNDWRVINKLVGEIKASFNHHMQFQYEQHLSRERDFRAEAKPQEGGKV